MRIPRSAFNLNNEQMDTLLWIKQLEYIVPYREGKANGNGKLELGALVKPDGGKYVAAFTSWDELRKSPYTIKKAALMSFGELTHEVFINPNTLAGIAVNPFSKMLLLSQRQMAMIEMMAENFCFQSGERTGSIQLSKPKDELPELVDALKVFFRSREQVFKAYILTVREPGCIMEKLLFIVDFNGNEEELFMALSEIIRRHIAHGMAFGLIKATYNLLFAAEEITRPMYIRF